MGRDGFDATSQAAICEAAGATRGALYHHFPDGKPGLFRAVLDEVLSEIVSRLDAAAGAAAPDERAGTVLDAYFEVALRPDVLRLTLQDAPAVLGLSGWRRTEQERFLPLIAASSASLGARMVYGALLEATLAASEADEPAAVIANAKRLIIEWTTT